MREVGTRISIKLINVFQVVLAVAAANYVESCAYKSHAVTCSHLRAVFAVWEIVIMRPLVSLRIERVQVVETLSVWSRTTKQKQFLTHIAQWHACTGSRTFPLYDNLLPNLQLQIESKKVVKTLLTIPASENIQFTTYDARAVISSGRRRRTFCWDFRPFELLGVELV